MKLRSLHLDKSITVEWNDVFFDRGHICLEFEHLDKSLYDFMEERYFQPLLLREIRPIVQQVCPTDLISALVNSLKILLTVLLNE